MNAFFKINSRREFLKKTGTTGILAFALPNLVSKAEPTLEISSKNLSTDGLVFLFQGDSITDGNRGRNTDPNHIMGHGYAFSIASRIMADFPEKKFIFYNRGISGNKVTDLELRWQQDSLDLKPNILSILIGINDSSSVVFPPQNGIQVTAEKYEEIYKKILNQSKAQNPDILFVLCQPFILPVGMVKNNWTAYQYEVKKRQEIVLLLAENYKAILVDFQEVMNKACKLAPEDYWMWDGIHPTVAGHELLAREWIKQVSQRLSFLKKYSE